MKRVPVLMMCCLMLLCGCRTSEPQSPSPTVGDDHIVGDVNPVGAYNITQIPVYETIPLEENERIRLLDAQDDTILLAIDARFSYKSPKLAEMCPSWYTKQVVLYDIRSEQVMSQIDFPVAIFPDCMTAKLISSDSYYYTEFSLGSKVTKLLSSETDRLDESALEAVENTAILKTVLYANGTQHTLKEKPVISFIGANWLSDLAIFEDGTLALSHTNDKDTVFGVDQFDKDGNRKELLSFESDVNHEHLEAKLSSNGKEVAYYMAKNQVGTMMICNKNGEVSEIPLPAGCKMYDFCLLPDALLLSVEAEKREHLILHELLLFQLDGTLLEEIQHEQLYRMKSDGGKFVIGIGNGWDMRALKIENQHIVSKNITHPSYEDPVFPEEFFSFCATKPGYYLAHFDTSKEFVQFELR